MTLYITSVSFEDRCLALASSLASRGEKGARVLLLDFRGYESVDPYLSNRARLLDVVADVDPECNVLTVGLGAPLDGVAKLQNALADLRPTRVVLDISTLPRSYLFVACRLLCDLGLETMVRYYRPETYGGQLSRGVGRVQSVPGFEGVATGSGRTALILILGFEGYKSRYAWEQLGPTRTVALLGDPPYKAEFLETARENNAEIFRQLGGRIETGRLHTFDVGLASKQLLELDRRLRLEEGDVEIVVCPLGTKPQSVAAFVFAYGRPEVAIAHVSSLMYYTGDYSRGFKAEGVEVSLQSLVRRSA